MGDLDEVIEARKKATPRPWTVRGDDQYDHLFTVGQHSKRICNVFGGLNWEFGRPTAEYIALAANHADKYAERLKRIGEILPLDQLQQATKHCGIMGTDCVTITMEAAEARELLRLVKD